MLDLERLAVLRADEQLEAGAWKLRDRDEPKREGRPCVICEVRTARSGAVCGPCALAGWTGTPCERCGGRTTRTDAMNKHFPRTCATCRAAIRQNRNRPEAA